MSNEVVIKAREITVLKRTAMNVYPAAVAADKLKAQIEELTAEYNAKKAYIDAQESYWTSLTGYSVTDLVKKEIVHTGKVDEKTQKEIIKVVFNINTDIMTEGDNGSYTVTPKVVETTEDTTEGINQQTEETTDSQNVAE